ncbi:MAG: alpha/beta hydrolase [Bacteroides sp.]|nr:alpha/beta hydrolase [Bacteroides sp.]
MRRYHFYSVFIVWMGCMLFSGCHTRKQESDATVRSGRIDVGNGSLWYEEAGTGEAVILVHGHSLDHRMWDEQVEAFREKYRVIRYDLRGYGLSSSQTEDYPFTHVEDLVRLMDALHIEQAHIVGLSLGGFVGADMLGWFPERMKSAVLACGNIRKTPGPSQPMGEEESARRDREIAALKEKGVDVMKKEWFEGLMNSGGSRKQRMEKPLWEMIEAWDVWQPLHKEVRVIAGLDAWEKLQEKCPEVPVLLIEGRSPHNRYSENPEILNYLPQGRQIVLDDCGHMCNMEQPELFNEAVMEFLGSL